MSSQAPASQTASESTKPDFAKRFLNVFGAHMFGAAKQAGLPETPKGIVFFSTEATKHDKDGKPYRYRPAHLGRTIVLTPEQATFITNYLGLTEDPFGVRK